MTIESILPDILTSRRGHKIKDAKDFARHREEIKSVLEVSAYGKMPNPPDHLRVLKVAVDGNFCASKATLTQLNLICEISGHEYSFPALMAVPNCEGEHPLFIYASEERGYPGRYLPIEEICDRGYATLSFYIGDLTCDDADFHTPLMRSLGIVRRTKSAASKTAVWAWGLSRLLDYALVCKGIDHAKIAVIGHAHLALSALLAGGYDERFPIVVANQPSVFGPTGERLEHRLSPGANDEMLGAYLDCLLYALIPPRHLLLGVATGDRCCEANIQFSALSEACRAYKCYGMESCIRDIHQSDAPCEIRDNNVLYHKRGGTAYLSRDDWRAYMDYIDSMEKCK